MKIVKNNSGSNTENITLTIGELNTIVDALFKEHKRSKSKYLPGILKKLNKGRAVLWEKYLKGENTRYEGFVPSWMATPVNIEIIDFPNN